MSLKESFNGSIILQPGAYSRESVNLYGGFPLAATGIVGIVGESLTGPPGSSAGVQSYTVDQINTLVRNYGSGPIVDVARALASPARDARVTNGAQIIRIWKTNASAQATSFLKNQDTSPANQYTIKSKNYGANGNLVNFYITQGSITDDTGTITSNANITFPLAVANASSLAVVINGVTYTLSVATAPGGSVSMTQVQLVSLLNGTPITVGPDTATPTWAPSKPLIFAASGTLKVTGSIDTSILTAFSAQMEYAVMTITGGAFATALGFTAASTVNGTTLVVTPGGLGPVRGSRGNRIAVINQNATTETINQNPSDTYFSIQYTGAGSPAVMQVVKVGGIKYLKTLCTGAGSDNLTLKLSDYTIRDLVNLIANTPNYKCVTTYFNAPVLNAVNIDWYDSINIKTLPLNVKGIQKEIVNQVNNQSQLIEFTLVDEIYGASGLVSSASKRYLTGGVLGASTNTDFQNGFDALLSLRCNTVMPCVSRDATSDITDGLTDPASTYTIAAVILQADTHCRTASNTKNRSERNCYIGYKSSFQAAISAAKSLNSEFSSMAFQDISFLDASGNLAAGQPHVAAAMIAGIQSGLQIGESPTHKFINAFGISHVDYDARQDVDEALDAGLCPIFQPDGGGFRIERDSTTYGIDQNFVFNSVATLAVSHYVAYNLRLQLEAIFVGTGRQRASTAAQSIYNVTTGILTSFRDQGLLVPDPSNDFKGYKNLLVRIEGGRVLISVNITPVQSINFIFIDITLDNIRDLVA